MLGHLAQISKDRLNNPFYCQAKEMFYMAGLWSPLSQVLYGNK